MSIVMPARAQDLDSLIILPGDARLDPVDFSPYEVEYRSAFGRFFNQVRQFTLDSVDKISVVNLIASPSAVIVDHRIIDAHSMALEGFYSPYFAWGEEFLAARTDTSGYDWTRIPLRGGEPVRMTGVFEHRGMFDDLGFSPTYAALLPLPVGTIFYIPKMQPRRDGSVVTALVEHEVVGRETLSFGAGRSCECWVIEERAANGSISRLWVTREAPFFIKRHRDIGGRRDFISDIVSFRFY